MELALVAARSVSSIFIFMAVGFIACKAGVFTKQVSDGASKLLVTIFCPALAFCSFLREFDHALVNGILISVGLEALYYAIGFLLGHIFVKKDSPNMAVERASIVYENCGFIGIPIAQMVLGPEGVIYQAMRLAMFQFIFFTQATVMFGGNMNKKELLKTLRSPAVLSAVFGLIVFIFQIQLPPIILEPIQSIGQAATPLGMMIAGGVVARTNMKEVLQRKRVYLITFIKLILLPLILIVIVKLLHLSKVVAVSAVIAAGCPQGNFVNVYSELYNKDAGYSLGIFSLDTLLCMLTIPAMVALYGVL